MAKPRHRLSNEFTRHYLALGIALVLGTAAVLVSGRLTGGDKQADAIAQLVAPLLAYGLYGPLYLALTYTAFGRLRGEALRRELRLTRPPRTPFLRLLLGFGPRSWGVTIMLLAVLAVFGLLLAQVLHDNPFVMVAGLLCLMGSWILLVAVFAAEYARLWADGRAFRFPGDGDDIRRFSDFFYLSAQVGTTFSGSDVEVLSTKARSTLTAQSISGFVFSTVILALCVSLVLGN